jgi:16S rRNA (adenine1518-N6/adenine1519-N6)-dimethyltransferase
LDHPLSLPKLDVPFLLRQYGLHPNKSLGQNFLVDDTALQQVISAADISSEDVVLEIGPGLGNLTRQLAVCSRYVVAVEIDSSLIPALNQVVGEYSNVRVIEGDILALDLSGLVSQSDYLVVANIPYYITSALIRHLLEAIPPPTRLVLTIQEQVAERICAGPGDMSLLALSVQVYGQPAIVARIPASAFYPPPNVNSAVLRIDRFASPLIPSDHLDVFFQLTRAGFSQKRKTMRNSLAGGLHLPTSSTESLLKEAHIDPMRRAESLNLNEWHHLTDLYSARTSPGKCYLSPP